MNDRKILVCIALLLLASTLIAKTSTGLDVLRKEKFAPLKGKRIGFICNQTSVDGSGTFGPDLLVDANVKLVALFSPEHGFAGIRKAGIESDTATSYRGVNIYSLYGAVRKPTKQMLAGIDALVFDIQDIGVRPYTYLSTMVLAMEAAAENKIEFIVLDRPNPLGGHRVEGNILDTSLKSFVGQVPVPYIHGMTLGELALMAKGEGWFEHAPKLKLRVIKMHGWKRSMTWDATGLEWTPPSPNIPTPDAAFGAAMTGAIGELGILSIGIGTDAPFQRIGSRLISQDRLRGTLDSLKPKGSTLIDENYTAPFADSTKTYNGLKFEVPSYKNLGDIYTMQFRMLNVFLKTDSNLLRSYNALPFSVKNMFDKVTGTRELRKTLEQGGDLSSVISSWREDTDRFKRSRKQYLLYE